MTLLTPHDLTALHALYRDGAWSRDEVFEHLTEERYNHLFDLELLATMDTDMGLMTLLLSKGRKAAGLPTTKGHSFDSQIDRAYLRLCIAELGWQPSDPRFSLDLKRFDVTDRFVQVTTPQGEALVAGRLSGHGFSRNGMAEMIEKFRAPALTHGFRVVIFTPSQRLGETLEAKHHTYFDIIRLIPNLDEDDPEVPSRVKTVKGTTLAQSSYPDRHITPSMADLLQRKGYPRSTTDLLLKPLNARIAQAQADLAVDEVITDSQLHNHYGLKPGDLTGARYVQELVRPIFGRGTLEVPQMFICASRTVARRSAPILGHKAGTTELRHLLGAPADPAQWLVEKRNTHRSEEPDALWKSPHGLFAVEYDSGGYSHTTVHFKVSKFREKEVTKIIWGVPSPLRRQRISEQHQLETHLIEWWKTTNDF